jgi:hypothetical protein
MVRKFVIALLVLMTGVLMSSRASAVVDVEGRYWFSTLDSTVQVTTGSIIGTELDFIDDLGISDKENFLEGRIILEFGNHSLRYGYIPLKWDETSTLSRTVTFGGQSYTVGTSVESELKSDYHRLGYQYNVIDVMDNHLGVIFELKYFDTRASLKATSLGFDEAEAIKAPIPTVGLAAGVSLPFLFSIEGEITGISFGKDIYMYDAEAVVNLKPLPFIDLSGGYRVMKFHVEDKDDFAELTLSGPFLMLRADF